MLLDKLLRRPAAKESGPPPVSDSHPSSYAEEVELALVAAVFGTSTDTDRAGTAEEIRAVVDRWHLHRDCCADKLTHISGLDDYAFARIMGDPGTLGGRPRTCVVQDAADSLITAGLIRSADVVAAPERAAAALLDVRGVEPSTIRRFLELLDVPQPATPTGA